MAKTTIKDVFLELDYIHDLIQGLSCKLRKYESNDLDSLEISRLLTKSLNGEIVPAIELLKFGITPSMLKD